MAIKLKVQSDPNVALGVQDNTVRFGLGDNVQVVQSGDYDDLTNRPQINGVTLTGNKTTEDLGIQAGVTSWNGQTGDVTYTPPVESVNGQTGEVVLTETDPTVPSWAKAANPPTYELTYDEAVSVGVAEVGTAKTGTPNYTPSGAITGTITKEVVTLMTSGEVGLNYGYSADYKLKIFGITFTPTTTAKNLVTGIGNLNFTGNGVKFAVEQEN